MTLREEAVEREGPSLSSIANISEYIALFSAAVIVLTAAALGVAGIILGFSVGLAITFGEIVLGVLLIGSSFFALSLLIGLIETTYYEEESLPEQAAEENEEPERETIGRRREPEEYEV